MIKYTWQIVCISLLLQSCQFFSKESDEREVSAKVYESILYEEEVLDQIPAGTSFEDSVNIRNSYINSWVARQLMVKQAELNLPDDLKDVSKKLEKYKNDLLVFSYQNKLLQEKLDTVVSAQQVSDYYEQRKSMFGLADYIVKVRYIKLDSNSLKEKNVVRWLMSDQEADFVKLEEYCYLHSANFYLDDNWLYLDDLLKEVPIVTYNKEKLLKNKKLIELFDNGYHYLVRIVDYKLKDGVSPLSLEEQNIKRIIINNRKIEFLEKLRADLYQKAKNNNQIEVLIH